MELDLTDVLGTIWQNERTGEIRRVIKTCPANDNVYLQNARGGIYTIKLAQLLNLYCQLENPNAAAAFAKPEPIAVAPAAIVPGSGINRPVDPLRRRSGLNRKLNGDELKEKTK